MVVYDWTSHLVVFALLIVLLIFKRKFFSWYQKFLKYLEEKSRILYKFGKGFEFFLEETYKNSNIKINSSWKSIIIPFVSSVLLFLIFNHFFNLTSTGFNFEQKLISSFLVPVSEEILVRGVLLGVFFFSLIIPLTISIFRKFNIKYSKFVEACIVISGIFLSSYFFAINHPSPYFVQFVSGIFYSLVYLFDRRNLTPAIVAHMTNNIIANFFI